MLNLLSCAQRASSLCAELGMELTHASGNGQMFHDFDPDQGLMVQRTIEQTWVEVAPRKLCHFARGLVWSLHARSGMGQMSYDFAADQG